MNETKKRCSFARICEALLLLFCTAALIFSTGSGYVKKLIESYRYPREFREYVEEYAALYGVEANIVYAIIKAESGFCRTAVSRSGAIGLMQVIPDTYLLDIRDNIGLDEPSSVLFQAKENIQSGTYYFAKWYGHFGSYVEALAAYNAGVGNVQKWLADETISTTSGLIIDKIPFEETKNYINRVLSYKEKYDELYGKEELPQGDTVSERLCYGWAVKYGEQYKIDPRFVMAVVKAESSFRPDCVSVSGAVGMMQIMKPTYEGDIKANLKLEEEFDALFDAEFNVKCGTYYLHWLDERLDGYEQLAAAYNGGIGNVRKWLADPEYSSDGKTLIVDNIPLDQTKRYVKKVMTFYEEYCLRYPDVTG